MRIIDMKGQKFNRLTIIERHHSKTVNRTLWLCKCDCGNKVIAEGYQIRKGYTKSCGCYRNETIGSLNKTHGKRDTHLYTIYTAMKSRCNNKNNSAYKDYGGRGISVCKEWGEDFQNFYDWALGNGYKRKLTLDRVDVNGDYEPSNCRWVTMKQQQNNRRNNIFINHNGIIKTINEAATEEGVPYDYIYARYVRDYRKERERAKELGISNEY